MLKKLRLWWFGRPLPIALTDEDDEICGLVMPKDGAADRLRKRWLQSDALRPAVAFVAGSLVSAFVTVAVEHLFR